MLDENDITEAMSAFLISNGWQITQKLSTREKGVDLKAKKPDGSEIWVECKGGTSSFKGSNRFGKPYTPSQVFDRVSKGAYTAMCMQAESSRRILFDT